MTPNPETQCIAYYINRNEDISRRGHMEEMLRELGYNEIHRVVPVRHHIAHISLSQTHKQIIEYIHQNQLSDTVYHIFEDDAELVPDIPRKDFRQEFLQQKWRPDAPIVYLGICLLTHEYTADACSGRCTHAYMVVNPNMILAEISAWDDHIDVIFERCFKVPVLGFAYESPEDKTHRGYFYQACSASWYTPSRIN
ncbi:hypothetical protein ACFL17_08880 [Pseudomonadota bacterium]